LTKAIKVSWRVAHDLCGKKRPDTTVISLSMDFYMFYISCDSTNQLDNNELIYIRGIRT